MELSRAAVKAWSQRKQYLRRRRRDTSADVVVLQALLNRCLIRCGPADGDFGGRTESAVERFQSARIASEEPDGIVGPLTRGGLWQSYDSGWRFGEAFAHGRFNVDVYGGEHPSLGTIPDRTGKMSTFGGPDDQWDRGYGQALIPCEPPTVAELYQRYPQLVEIGLFRPGLSDPLPQVTCEGRTMPAGISWCLNPESYYLAMRWHYKNRPRPHGGHRALITCGDLGVVVAPTDYGPARWTGKSVDISPGAADALRLEPYDDRLLQTGSSVRVQWAKDGTELGPVDLWGE
jgi:hypothetical protein